MIQKEKIDEIVAFLKSEPRIKHIIFLCTHNARRSQFSELWFCYFTEYYNLPYQGYSAGVEATRVHPHVISTIRQDAAIVADGDNPEILIQPLDVGSRPFYSKTLEDPSLPVDNFMTIAVCDHAAETCPIMPGSAGRFAVPFVDPGAHDQDQNPLPHYKATSDLIKEHMRILCSQLCG